MDNTRSGIFDWDIRIEHCRSKMRESVTTGAAQGFCRVCGAFVSLSLTETVGFCTQCKMLRRCYNPFREEG